MTKPGLSVTRAHELVAEITEENDGAHVDQLLELFHGTSDPNNIVAIEVEKQLYSLTSDFQSHFAAYLERLRAA